MAQIADAVLYIHSLKNAENTGGGLHGDLKAANVLVDKDGSIKLIDFGLSKLQASMPTEQEIAGRTSYQWRAPELWTEDTHKSKMSDIFAFGMTIAEVSGLSCLVL